MPKSLPRKQRDGGLQGVAIFAGDAHEIALDGDLDLQLAVLDLLHDVARLLGGDSLLQGDLLLHGGAGGGNDLAVDQALQRHLALDQFGLQNVDHGLELELVTGLEDDLVVLLFQFDGGVRVLQVEALLDFLQRLLHGVVHFRHFDLGNDVKAVIGHRLVGSSSEGSGSGRLISNPNIEPDRRRMGLTRRTGSTRGGDRFRERGAWGDRAG